MDTEPSGFIEAVEQALRARVTPVEAAAEPGQLIGRIAAHLTTARGAHRVRPLVVQLVGTSLGAAPERLVELAAAAELIHTASLFHDDVVDGGQVRRGLPSANASFGNAASVLAGDWVLSRAFGSLQAYPHALTVYAVELVAEMSIGALAEVEARGRPGLTPEAWRWLAERKCGLLFGFAARAAALVAGRPDLAPRLHDAFCALGVAFQKADDLKDVLDPGSGKDRFADLRNQNPSWATACAVQNSPAYARALAQAWAEVPTELTGADLGADPGAEEATTGSPGLAHAGEAQPLARELARLCLPLAGALETELGQAAAAVGQLLGPSAEPALKAFLEHTWGRLPRKATA